MTFTFVAGSVTGTMNWSISMIVDMLIEKMQKKNLKTAIILGFCVVVGATISVPIIL